MNVNVCRYNSLKKKKMNAICPSNRFGYERSGVRFPGWLNRAQYRQRHAAAATFLRSCVVQRKAAVVHVSF